MKKKSPPPHAFVLEELESRGVDFYTKPMFGCLAVYVGEKIVLILRDKEDYPEDSGVWVATVPEHHASLRKDFPGLRSIKIFGPGETGWQVFPQSHPDFEEVALALVKAVRGGDSRIGKVPKRKKKRARSKALR